MGKTQLCRGCDTTGCVCRLCPKRIINIPADSRVFVGSSHKAAGKGFVLNSPDSHGQGGVDPSARRRALRLCVCVATFPGSKPNGGKKRFLECGGFSTPCPKASTMDSPCPFKAHFRSSGLANTNPHLLVATKLVFSKKYKVQEFRK